MLQKALGHMQVNNSKKMDSNKWNLFLSLFNFEIITSKILKLNEWKMNFAIWTILGSQDIGDMCYGLITYNGIEYCSCNFGTWYFQGKVVKIDMVCPFCVSCHINIHLDTSILSSCQMLTFVFKNNFFG
jgi:hypothetical protein